MAKYSDEFKMKLVTEYLYGNLGYKALSKKYNIPSALSLKNWVRSYKSQGAEGIVRKHKKVAYSVQFKLDAIQFILETGDSYPETAVQFQMNNPSLIQSWLKTYLEKGIEGLKPVLKEQPSMPKKVNKQNNENSNKPTREKELERENELLRLENAYLKKLRAFRKNPGALHEKHKQNWHSNSKKKGSD